MSVPTEIRPDWERRGRVHARCRRPAARPAGAAADQLPEQQGGVEPGGDAHEHAHRQSPVGTRTLVLDLDFVPNQLEFDIYGGQPQNPPAQGLDSGRFRT